MSLSLDQISEIVSKISYKAWVLRVLPKGDGFLIQTIFSAPHSKTGVPELQQGRKWWISSHACEGEIVRTAYKAIEAAELHEMQEHFLYCGQTIFNPHLNPEDLALQIAGGWIGESVRGIMPAPAEFKAAARAMLEKTAKIVTKVGHKPKKPRIGNNNERRSQAQGRSRRVQ